MAAWDVVSTIKAPADQVLAFAAHHLSLGADHLWLFFDDPDAAIPAVLEGHPKVTVTRCDAAYWQAFGKRHERHQNRQARNAREAYGQTKSPWLAHLDVDEFLQADRPVAAILGGIPVEALVVQLEPFEAMHDPGLDDDIFTARTFRGPLRPEFADLRPQVLGDYAKVIPEGMLSHTVGKCFFRTGVRGLAPRLHGAMLGGERVRSTGRNPDLRVLHFHAQDRESWRAALPFRLTRGAYQYRPELQAFLLAATPQEIDRFYQRTQLLPPDLADKLCKLGRVRIADLALREKVRDLMAGTP